MSCPMCKDVAVAAKDNAIKGSSGVATTAARHMCPSCDTKSEFAGQGKQTKDKVSHDCNMAAGSNSCCM